MIWPPGYRWLDLHADGRIETGVSRVWNVAFNVELDSGGYLIPAASFTLSRLCHVMQGRIPCTMQRLLPNNA